MFTGIIEELGTIKALGSSPVIAATKVLEDVHIGDSIAVNGICLTVTSFTSNSFSVDVMPETIRRTSLAGLTTGSKVNLERAMAAGGRFGGHIVSGHIDGTGTVVNYKKEGNAIWLTIKTDSKLLRQLAPKGSVALDGISLTIVDCLSDSFTVSLIPHTAGVTTILNHKPGDIINIETDVIAKYISHILKFDKENKPLDLDFLNRCGF